MKEGSCTGWCQNWFPKGGDSSSVEFGAVWDTSGPTVAEMTMSEDEVVKTVYHMLTKAVGTDKFLWTTLQIEVGTVGRRRGRADATGTCIMFSTERMTDRSRSTTRPEL